MVFHTQEAFKSTEGGAARHSVSFGGEVNLADPLNFGMLHGKKNETAGEYLKEMRISSGDDDYDSVPFDGEKNERNFQKENERAMNRMLPSEYPQLNDDQKKIAEDAVTLLTDFFSAGGFKSPEAIDELNALTKFIKAPPLNGLLEQDVVDTINKRLQELDLKVRISSVEGETYLGMPDFRKFYYVPILPLN